MPTTVRPLYDFCLVRRDKSQDKIGSIWIPDAHQEVALEGTVLAVGPGISNHKNGSWRKLEAQVGDRILFGSRYESGTEFELNGEKCLMLRHDDLAALLAPLRPLYDRVIVRRRKEADKIGSIFIPDSAKEKSVEGDVIAVGTGKILENGVVRKFDVKVGDVVMFGRFGGTEVRFEEEDRVILREDDILAVIDP